MGKKSRQQKKMKEQLHLTNERGPTFVGLRPHTIETNRQKAKQRQREKRSLPTLAAINNKDQDYDY